MSTDQLDAGRSYAVVVFREEGRWEVGVLPERLSSDLQGLIAALRQQPGEGGSIALVNVSDEFFLALRRSGEELRVLLSDVTASVAWDLAKQVVDFLEVAPLADERDVEEVWPAGDLSIFDDLGMDEMELGAVLSDVDAYADEMLLAIASRLGFTAPLERALDSARH